jgi:branched-chain amino acid transport system permease protein
VDAAPVDAGRAAPGMMQSIALGLANGSIYGIFAIGIVLILRTTGIANFGHADMGLVAGFMAYTVTTSVGLPVLVGVLTSVVAGGVIGALAFVLVVNLMRGAAPMSTFIATFVLGGCLNVVVQIIWGPFDHTFPPVISGRPNALQGITWQEVLIVVVALACVVLVQLFLHSTRLGLGIRAQYDDRLAAELAGVSSNVGGVTVWVIGIALAGLAASLSAPTVFLGTTTLSPYLLKAFAGAVIGGISNIWGAYVGCLLLGVAEVLVGRQLPSNLLTLRDSLSLALMVIVLWWRPNGIFSAARAARVA